MREFTLKLRFGQPGLRSTVTSEGSLKNEDTSLEATPLKLSSSETRVRPETDHGASREARPTPRIVSHYEILQPLGKGGMGEVFEGYDRTLKRKVALKAIRADRRLSTNARARFLREARILSQLDHPSICRIHDYVQEQDSDWLVLELIDGRSLHDALHDGLDVSVKMRVAQQVAQVLIVTHAADIIHRDLKPGNIMLTKHGDTKVLDFGLARSGDPQSGASESPAPEPSTDVDLSAVTVERPLSEPSPTERPTKFQTSPQTSALTLDTL